MDEMEIRHRCFMDGIEWQHHLEADAGGTKLYPSERSLRRAAKCIETGGCGVVEVEVRLIRWVEPQNLKWDHDNPAEMQRMRDEIERLRAAQKNLLNLIDQNCHRGLVESAERIVRLADAIEI